MCEYYPIGKLYRVLTNMYTFTIGNNRVGAYEFMKYYSTIWESRLFDGRLVEKAKKTHLNVSRETLKEVNYELQL